MSEPRKSSFISRIRGSTDTLHPSEKRLADAILNFPGQIASYSATELAQLAQVSNATVTRFVRKIGYASFDEARQAVRAEQMDGAALLRVANDDTPQDGLAARYVEQSRLNVERSLLQITDATLAELVSRMLSARRLWVLGFRAGQPFARYLGWQVLQARSDVLVLPRDGETMAESLAAIGPDDCVILFALRRPPKILGTLPALLNNTGASVAIIGDVVGLEDMRARWHLPCATAATGPIFNHVGVMALCGMLASQVIEVAGNSGRQRLSTIEDLHDSLDEL